MTIDTFIRALKKTPRKWQLAQNELRLWDNVDEYCPLTAVASQRGHEFHVGNFDKAAQVLGLGRKDAYAILRAADNTGQIRLRKRLLRACGLEAKPHA